MGGGRLNVWVYSYIFTNDQCLVNNAGLIPGPEHTRYCWNWKGMVRR